MKRMTVWVMGSFLFLAFSSPPISTGANPAASGGEEKRFETKGDSGGVFEQQRDPAKAEVSKRKFPWLLVLFGGAVAAVAVYFFVIKKSNYTLTVTTAPGIQGSPAAGSYKYKKGQAVDYAYTDQAGIVVSVKLDGQSVVASGTVTMNGDHTLEVQAINVPQDVKRVVVAEEFTATWCGNCPGAAMGLDELKKEAGDRLAVISYHSSHSGDPYSVYEIGLARQILYNVTGIPDVYFNGTEHVLGGSVTQSQYSQYKPVYDRCVAVTPLVTILLVVSGSNAVDIIVTNIASNPVNGTLHVAIIENDIPCVWINQSVLQFVCRAMLPNESGERITLSPGQTIEKIRTFALDPGWNRSKCRIVAFLQGDSKEIYQGAEIGL